MTARHFMLASDYSGAAGFFLLVPGILLLLAVIGFFLAIDGNRWSLLLAVLPIVGGCFFGSLVLFYPDQLGLFYCFWLPAPLIVAIVSIVTLFIRRRALRKKL